MYGWSIIRNGFTRMRVYPLSFYLLSMSVLPFSSWPSGVLPMAQITMSNRNLSHDYVNFRGQDPYIGLYIVFSSEIILQRASQSCT